MSNQLAPISPTRNDSDNVNVKSSTSTKWASRTRLRQMLIDPRCKTDWYPDLPSTFSSASNSDEATWEYSLDIEVPSVYHLFKAISIFVNYPQLSNGRVRGSEILRIGQGTCRAFKSYALQDLATYVDFSEPFKRSAFQKLLDETERSLTKKIESNRNSEVEELVGRFGRFDIVRCLVGRFNHYVVSESWCFDSSNLHVEIGAPVIYGQQITDSECPALRLKVVVDQSNNKKASLIFNVHETQWDSETEDEWKSNAVYTAQLIEKWSRADEIVTVDASALQVKRSLNLLPIQKYFCWYDFLKRKHFQEIAKDWTETTDIAKFLSEEIGIASYLLTFIYDRYDMLNVDDRLSEFVDIGCGNGVLSYFLTCYLGNGIGVDVRSRKLWSVLSTLSNNHGRQLSLQELCIVPSTFDIGNAKWIIGNHCDELTPWIPIWGAQKKVNFFILPCCPWDFTAKFMRRDTKKSTSNDYVDYIEEIATKCGFTCLVDRLRIPSTKRICLIGIYTPDSKNETEKQTFLEEKLALARVHFKPRDKEIVVNNASRIAKPVSDSMVLKIFNGLLISAPTKCTVKESRSWNSGRLDMSLRETVSLLSVDEKRTLSKQGKGIQTFVKNNSHVFVIVDNFVRLKKPESYNNEEMTKLRTKPCFFHAHHPDGCPLMDSECKFVHCNCTNT